LPHYERCRWVRIPDLFVRDPFHRHKARFDWDEYRQGGGYLYPHAFDNVVEINVCRWSSSASSFPQAAVMAWAFLGLGSDHDIPLLHGSMASPSRWLQGHRSMVSKEFGRSGWRTALQLAEEGKARRTDHG